MTTDLVELLSLNQAGMSLSNFVSEIKDCCTKCNQIPRKKRQSFAIKILLRGLDDKILSEAVSLQNPKSLEETITLIKSVKVRNNNQHDLVCTLKERDNYSNPIIRDLQNDIGELNKQVSNLNQIVLALKSKIENQCKIKEMPQSGPYYNYNSSRPRFHNYNYNYVKIFTGKKTLKSFFYCGKDGHIARVCRAR